MTQLKLPTKLLSTGGIFLAVLGLISVAFAEPKLADSSFVSHNNVAQQNGAFSARSSNQIGQDDSAFMPTANLQSQAAKTAETNIQAPPSTSTITTSSHIKIVSPPTPIPCPKCHATETQLRHGSPCHYYCRPIQPPQCAPCGGFHKVSDSESADHIACPMYCVE